MRTLFFHSLMYNLLSFYVRTQATASIFASAASTVRAIVSNSVHKIVIASTMIYGQQILLTVRTRGTLKCQPIFRWIHHTCIWTETHSLSFQAMPSSE